MAPAGTDTVSKILSNLPQLRSCPSYLKKPVPIEYDPALTDDTYSLLLPKSVLATSIVIVHPLLEARPEKVTSQYGADDPVPPHTSVCDCAPSTLPRPATHVQSADVLLPERDVLPGKQSMHVLAVVAAVVFEYLAGSQSVHSADPDAALCLPAAHPTHGPPSGPLKPALHRHAAAVALADAEYELAGHPTHALADVAFVVAKYLPLAQLVHAADPVDAL